MVGSVGAIQGILVAAFLILGGLGKLFELDPEKRRRSLLGSITGGWSLARPASLLLAGAECWLGMAVVFGRWVPLPEVASALFLATAGATLALGVRAMPGADCGCLGAVGSARIGWRTVTRAGVLAGLATSCAFAGRPPLSGLDNVAAVTAALGEAALLVWLSPEFRSRAFVRRLPTLLALPCWLRRAPAATLVARVRASDLWSEADVQAPEPTDLWRDGCWGFLCFPARYQSANATAVFAVRLGLKPAPTAVAFVDERTASVLGHLSLPSRHGSTGAFGLAVSS